MISAADLRHRIAFESRGEEVDEYGGSETSFSEQFVVSAAVKAKMGGETVTAARLTGQQPILITVRQSSQTQQITTDWRARNERDGTIYAIKSVADPDDGGQWIELLCQTGVSA